MAPEGQGAQVLPDPDLGPEKVTRPYQIRCALQLLFNKVFAKTHGWGSRGTLYPLYAPRTRGVGVPVRNPPRTFPPSRTTSVPNFVPIRPAVWISIENRHTHTQTFPLCIRFIKERFQYVYNTSIQAPYLVEYEKQKCTWKRSLYIDIYLFDVISSFDTGTAG